MPDQSIFNAYLLSIRTDYSTYAANASDDFRENGTRTVDQQVKMAKLNQFTAYMYVMNDFDPADTLHTLTADEMSEIMFAINYLVGGIYHIDFSIYY